jgi:6-pyruvoyltetrahydropterin/6-carboxytetrahydropterin synthase
MDLNIAATRYHDISCGHRVVGHEGKCAHMHGHNYRFYFTVQAEDLSSVARRTEGLDNIGRVLDFGVIKRLLCMWLEDSWDHKFLVFDEDPWAYTLQQLDPRGVVLVPFNPTAENMAAYMLTHVGPNELQGTGCKLVLCTIEETAKCSATAQFR